jgi:hypothetical protein
LSKIALIFVILMPEIKNYTLILQQKYARLSASPSTLAIYLTHWPTANLDPSSFLCSPTLDPQCKHYGHHSTGVKAMVNSKTVLILNRVGTKSRVEHPYFKHPKSKCSKA